MTTVRSLLDKLGRDRVTRETSLQPQLLSRAAVDNLMPSGWYPEIRDLCRADGMDCPEFLFRWRRSPLRPGDSEHTKAGSASLSGNCETVNPEGGA